VNEDEEDNDNIGDYREAEKRALDPASLVVSERWLRSNEVDILFINAKHQNAKRDLVFSNMCYAYTGDYQNHLVSVRLWKEDHNLWLL